MSIKKLKQENNIILDDPPEADYIHSIKSLYDLEKFQSVLNNMNTVSLEETIKMFITEFKLPDFIFGMFIQYKTVVNIKLDNIFINFNDSLLNINIDQYELLPINHKENDMNRELQRLTTHVFNTFINPLVFNSVRLTNIKPIKFYSLIIRRINSIIYNISCPTIKANYITLLNWLREEKNEFFYDPFNFELKDVYVGSLDSTIKVRKSCCMRYMMKGQNRCNTCPQKF
ncbi:(2Fe-2S)-binding protein [Haloplasma contractile]|uniref:FhuF 2Fe-2S domain protein n=1 Tax=Haloplasma contractile SSD-17B TaxID=1033810 RepID=U2E9G9_9MOLU|nr:(2Fe-2S)-binding protein [Haloplasma contractile]ERJ11496.1 FhuF 2Fe-2S domain protein [Haloplasma contractile SSD-17B]